MAALSLTTMRLALGPVVLLLAGIGGDERWIAVSVIAAGLSDVYDGRVARRFGVDTPGLRRFDSVADTIFYICAAIALWLTHPDIVRGHAWLLGAFAAMQIAGHLIDVAKFGRDTSYHTWTGRAFGLTLFIAGTVVFWTGHAGPWLAIALVVGMVAHVDAFAISMVLPEWRYDVHTIRNALRIRRSITHRQIASTADP